MGVVTIEISRQSSTLAAYLSYTTTAVLRNHPHPTQANRLYTAGTQGDTQTVPKTAQRGQHTARRADDDTTST